MSETISIRRSLNWIGLAQAAKLALQVIGVVVLARILEPADYGLMAMASTVIGFASLFKDFGTGAALIQTENVNRNLQSTLFLFNVLIGALLTVAMLLAAPLAAHLFAEPRLAPVIFAVAPLFFISSFGIVHQSMLERASEFKSIALVEIASGIAGLSCALILALRGGGVYALAAQALTAAGFTSALLLVARPWKPSWIFHKKSLSGVWAFSRNVFVFGCANYAQRNADTLLIGRVLGPADLGAYNLAYRLLLLPLQNITFVINRAVFPAYSRRQSQMSDIADHYLQVLRNIAFVTAPLMAVIWLNRECVIDLALGPQWKATAYALAWLAPVGFFQSLVSTSGTVLNSIGRSDVLRNLGLLGLPVLVGSIAVGVNWGIEGVASAYCLANLFWIYPVIGTVLRLLSCPFGDFLGAIGRSSIVAAGAAFSCRLVQTWLLSAHYSQLLAAIFVTTFFVALYLAGTWKQAPQFLQMVLGRSR